MRRIVFSLVCMTFVVVCSNSALADDPTKIVMHAIPHDQRVHCYLPAELGYQDPGSQTAIIVDPFTDVDVFLYLYDYELARGVGFQLAWPDDWTYYGWSGDCLHVQITVTDFHGTSIEIGTVFDRITGGALAPLGYAGFTTGAAGEVQLLGSPRMCPHSPTGICYLTEEPTEHPIDPAMTGRVAVGDGGYNPVAPNPVAATTWGAIKAQYR